MCPPGGKRSLAMGYKIPERRTDKVTFGPPWEGAEFVIRMDATIGTLEKFDYLREQQGEEFSHADQIAYLKLFSEEILVSWNLEDENGEPIPPNLDGIKKLPLTLLTAIMDEYQKHQTEVPENLGEASISGNGSATQLTEMATLSQSPQS
jgi:hypothetical protein